MSTERPPLPPFTVETAVEKVRLAEDGRNSRDPEKLARRSLGTGRSTRSRYIEGLRKAGLPE
jgi:nuclear transport factor 2 (NTF2) superfamily protein